MESIKKSNVSQLTAKESFTVHKLLSVMAAAYPHDTLEIAIDTKGDPFNAVEPNPLQVGDNVAYFLIHRCVEVYEGLPGAMELHVAGTLVQSLNRTVREIEAVRDGLVKLMVHQTVLEFLQWFKKSGRTTMAAGLFKSWCDVYPSEVPRELFNSAFKVLLTVCPGLSSEAAAPTSKLNLESVVEVLNQTLNQLQTRDNSKTPPAPTEPEVPAESSEPESPGREPRVTGEVVGQEG